MTQAGGDGQHVDPEALERLRARLAAYMVKKGLRSTAQRRMIVDAFFEGASHMTIEDLLNEVRHRDRGIGYATVYRTLKLLAECGVASERKFSDGLSRYELADDASTHHDHLICLRCSKITEFEEPRIEELQDEVAARYGFVIASHKHEMYGTCAECQVEEQRAEAFHEGAAAAERPKTRPPPADPFHDAAAVAERPKTRPPAQA